MQQPGEVRLRQPIHQRGRGLPARGIEAHVERLVALEREPPPGGVELPGRDAQVEQDRPRFGDAVLDDHPRQVGEAGVHQPRPLAEAREPAAGLPQRLGIGVEAEQAHVGPARRQQRFRVSAHAHRPVDHPAPVPRSQEKRDLVHEDGNVNS